MRRKQSAQGLGFNSANETSKELSKISYKKQMRTNEVSDVWREYESKYTNLKQMITFTEFKQVYFKRGKKGLNKLLDSKPVQESEIKPEFKPKIRRVTKDGVIISNEK
jgi:hypothetical protein